MLRNRRRPLRRGLLAVAMTIGVVAAIAGAAVADTLTISPGGSITGTSIGRLTFGDGFISITCDVQFSGTLARTATGTLGSVGPGNPRIGAITSASATGCSLFTAFEFLEGGWEWRMYARQGNPPHTNFHVYRNVYVLVTGVAGIIRCLYDLDLYTRENRATGVQTVERLEINSAVALPPSTQCFVEPWIQVDFGLAPGQTIE